VFVLMDKLGDTLGRIKAVSTVSRNHHLVSQIVKAWRDLAGKLADDISVEWVRDKVLYLSCTNSLWISEAEFIKPRLLERIGAEFGKNVIKSIKIRYFDPIRSDGSVMTAPVPKSLQQLILESNFARREQGMSLCDACGDVYCNGGQCIFCKVKSQSTQG